MTQYEYDSRNSYNDRRRNANDVWNTFDGDDHNDRRSQQTHARQQHNGYGSANSPYRGESDRQNERDWRSHDREDNTRFGSRDAGDYYRGSMRDMTRDSDDDYVDWDRERRNRYSSESASRGERPNDYGRMGRNYYSQHPGSYQSRNGSYESQNEGRWGGEVYHAHSDDRERHASNWPENRNRDNDYDDVYGNEGGRYGGRGNYGSGTNYGRGNYPGGRMAARGRDERDDRHERGDRHTENRGRGMYDRDPNAWSSFDRSIYRRDTNRYFGGGSNLTGDYGSRGETYGFRDNFGSDRHYSRDGRGSTTGWDGSDHRGRRSNYGG